MKRVERCAAKVNLFLSVGPPDTRGYHPLRTVFQEIAIFDTLEVETAAEDSVTCDWPDLPEQNTLTKALRLYSEFAKLPPLRIHLAKEIPAQSGLGGGSSDAAGLLRALQSFSPRPLEEAELRDIAAAVGADVPFFLMGGRARGEGYGERLTPLPPRTQQSIVVARPNVGVSTPAAYARLDETPRSFRDWPEGDELYNDFERVAPCESLELIDRLGVLGAEAATLCGSGSAVFAIFEDRAQADAAAARLTSEGVPWVRATHTL